jgi:hypothetical protein
MDRNLRINIGHSCAFNLKLSLLMGLRRNEHIKLLIILLASEKVNPCIQEQQVAYQKNNTEAK